MIPQNIEVVDNLINLNDYETPPSLTYRLDFINKRIISKVDGINAVIQFIQKVLDTTKYEYEIYDWYYGNELRNLIGKSMAYIETELPRIIRDALLVDDRIKEVTDFKFEEVSIDSMSITFTVITIFGDVVLNKEVEK